MNNSNKNNLTIGDAWEDIIVKKQHHNRSKEKDNIIVRMIRAKSGNIAVSIQIGVEICDLLGWKKADRLHIMRNKLNGTLIKLSKANLEGHKLYEPNVNPCRRNISLTIDFHKKYILENTKLVNFDLEKNYIVIDISNLCNE